jgi:hypothetical protein
MRKRITLLVAALMLTLTMAFGSVAAFAAPIDCPGGQTATKTASGWDCVNKGGNPSNAENPKNPNAGKGFF